MTNEKFIDGVLPCMCGDCCPLFKACGGDWDYKQPNTKKLVCLCKHIEELAKCQYEQSGVTSNNTLSDYAYQIFWIMHNEISETIRLLCKWEEPKNNRTNFLEVYNLFCRCYNSYDLTFLTESYQQLKMIANCFENAFE